VTSEAGARLAGVVEALEHLDLRYLRRVLFCGVAKTEHVLLDKLHDRHARDRLGAREGGEVGIRGHRHSPAELALSGGALVKILVAVRRHRDHARHAVLLLDRAAEHTL
jgi:hypothetical protein